MIMKKTWNRVLLLLAAVGFAIGLRGAEAPNILLILVDDLGWSDTGCYGNPQHQTPSIDRLAQEGMRFTAAYAAAPICSASRAALLTGRTPARLGFEFVTKPRNVHPPEGHALMPPPYTIDLPLEETTLAELLGPAGFYTGYYGKWHVSEHYKRYLGWSPTHGPLKQGYKEGDREFGCHPYSYYYDRKTRKKITFPDNTYAPDALTDKTIDFLRKNKDRRFFLQLSHYYVHDPVHTRMPWLFEKYRQTLPEGAAEVRAVYAAMVDTLDHLVGRVLDELETLGLAGNTLVVFMSDNGGHPAYAGNGPLRGSKWNLYEGGIRVPLIMRWPGVVKAGSICDEPVTGCDLFPTFREIAVTADDGVERDGRSLVPLLKGEKVKWERPLVWHFPYYLPEKGFDKCPEKIGVNDFRISSTEPHSAIRIGDYKLIHFYEDGRDELYNLNDDLSELQECSARLPEKADELRRKLDGYLKQVNARLPTPNPDYKSLQDAPSPR